MKPRILFVDDETSMLSVFGLHFREKGYEVVTANSGAQAMDLAATEKFNLAVFDIQLAGENGLQLLEYFKKHFPTLPVVMFTGLPEHDDLIEQSLLRGASGFMRKSDSLDDLSEAVKSYLPNC
jgi:DNA-binding NtrC family response regulator